MQELSFYVDAQIRVLDEDENVLADSGFPQLVKNISLDAKRSEDDTKRSGEDGITYSKTISIGRPEGSPFSTWLFSFQEGDPTDKGESEKETGRSRWDTGQP